MKTILIVDDQKRFLRSLAEGVASSFPDALVLTAEDGMEALEILKGNGVDLVITDLKMPVMDGFRLLVEIHNLGLNLPVMVMTAFGTPELRRRATGLGAVTWIEKPLELSSVIDSIWENLEFVEQNRARGTLRGIRLVDLLLIVEAEKKTCTILVKSGATQGSLAFRKGILLAANFGEGFGEEAFLQLVGAPHDELMIENVCYKRERLISKSVQELTAGMSGPDRVALPDHLQNTSPTVRPDLSEFIQLKEKMTMSNVPQCLEEVSKIDGFIAAALVDWKSGMCLGTIGGGPGFNIEVGAAGNTEVVRAKMKAAASLGLKEQIEDILITLETQIHLIRMAKKTPTLFFYVALNKDKSNLAMSRYKLTEIENMLSL